MDTFEQQRDSLVIQIARGGKPFMAAHALTQLIKEHVYSPTERLLSGKVTDFREAMELYIKQYDLRQTGTNCVSNHYQVAGQIALEKYNICMEETCDEVEARQQVLDDLFMETLHGDQPEIIKNELEIIRDALEHEDYATLAM